ncbi:MAG: hypothetical protein ACREPL_05975 [Rhodanobacteraceae bacterium]
MIRRALLSLLLCCALPMLAHAAPPTFLSAADVAVLVKPPA